MKLHVRHVVAVVVVGLCLVASSSEADPNSNSFDKVVPHEELSRLSAEWWQWALSIPTPVNPLNEGVLPMGANPTGETCMVGQRGPIWFLAGVLNGGTAMRTCTLPEGKELFFPVINSVEINTPNVCGQGQELSVEQMRLDVAPFIDNVSHLKVTLDGKPIHHLHRVESDVFDVTLPEDNIFDAPCAPSNVPAGVYSPAVDDGIYAFLRPLDAGTHTLHIQATSGSTSLDITYQLVVVPVTLK